MVPIDWPPLVREPGYALLLVSLALAIGQVFLQCFRSPSRVATQAEHSLIAISIGLGFLSFLPFALAMFGQMSRTMVAIGVGVLFVATLPRQLANVVTLWRWVRSGAARPRDRATWIWLVPVAPAIVLATLVAMTPPFDPDGLYYQLTAPRRWLSTGRLDYLPTLPQTNMPAAMNMLFAIALATWGDVAAKLTHTVCGLLSMATLFVIGRRCLDARAGAMLASLWFLGTSLVRSMVVPELFTFAYADLGVTFHTVAAVLAWMLWRRSGDNRWFAAAAACAGFATVFKFTAILFGAGLASLLWLQLRSEGRPLAKATFTAGLFFGLSLIPLAPWLLRTWSLTGNPFYLLLPGIFPTRDWPAEAGAVFSQFFHHWVWGIGDFEHVGEPARKMVRLAAMGLVAAGTALWVWRERNVEARGLGALAGLLIVGTFAGTGLVLRYLIFALPLVWFVVLWIGRPYLERSKALRAGIFVFLCANLLLSGRVLTRNFGDNIRVVTGTMSRDTFVRNRFPVKDLWDYVNKNLPKDGPLLLAAGRNSYYIDAPCLLTEAYFQYAIRMDNWEKFRSDLRKWNIRYVIANPSHTTKAYPGPVWPHADNEASYVLRLVTQEAKELACFHGDCVYEIKPEFLQR